MMPTALNPIRCFPKWKNCSWMRMEKWSGKRQRGELSMPLGWATIYQSRTKLTLNESYDARRMTSLVKELVLHVY